MFLQRPVRVVVLNGFFKVCQRLLDIKLLVRPEIVLGCFGQLKARLERFVVYQHGSEQSRHQLHVPRDRWWLHSTGRHVQRRRQMVNNLPERVLSRHPNLSSSQSLDIRHRLTKSLSQNIKTRSVSEGRPHEFPRSRVGLGFYAEGFRIGSKAGELKFSAFYFSTHVQS